MTYDINSIRTKIRKKKDGTLPHEVYVHLTTEEVAICKEFGGFRQSESVDQGLKDKYGAENRDPTIIHPLGVGGELAVAKHLDIPWEPTVNTFKLPDIGTYLQVRTRSRVGWDLPVRDDDRDDEVFILVYGPLPIMLISGWIWGRDAKNAEYRANHGGHGEAFFVPRDKLRSISELCAIDMRSAD